MLTTRRLATLILFIGLFAMATRVAVDSDTFWHLRAGTWMLDHGRLLNFEAFSHTRLNAPWINHSWLTEIPMAALYRAFGYAGLNLATAFIIWFTFLFVYLSGEGGSYLRAFVIVLAAAASGVYWSARPQIMSMLLAAIFNYILILYCQRSLNRLWLLPLLMILWVNLHGGFAIGFILLVINFVGQALVFALRGFRIPAEQSQRPLPHVAMLWVGGIGLACAAAVAINPYGLQMLLYPFKTVSIGVLQNYIQEWQSPNFHTREAQVFIILWLATFAAVGFGRRRLDPIDFLSFSAFTGLALLAGRNIAVFAVVAAPILMRHADSAIAELQERWPKLRIAASGSTPTLVTRIVNWALLVIVAAATVIKAALPLTPSTVDTAISKIAPVGAATYLKTLPVRGAMFNSYNFGGYLTWALYPDRPVFVDGRTDLYDDEFLTEYLSAYLAEPGWEKTFARYQIALVLVEPNAPIARALLVKPEWGVRYRDSVAVVIIKLNKEQAGNE